MDVAYCNDHCVFLVLKGVKQEVHGTCKNFNIFYNYSSAIFSQVKHFIIVGLQIFSLHQLVRDQQQPQVTIRQWMCFQQ